MWLLYTWALLMPILVRSTPEVTTSLGQIRGRVLHSRNGREYFSFTRIPYAQPPIESLRFMPPLPAKTWTGTLDATVASPICFQWVFDKTMTQGQEDCLYLNIYTPKISGDSLPVMVYIHGGGFTFGSAAPAESSKFFMDEDVVLVSMNYRLGRLGFLSFENETIPGNMGLKDQALALEWVKREINAFGGNGNLITVFGNSAGSVSAHYLCSSSRLKGLIKGCISQSGVGGSFSWSLRRQGESRLAALALSAALGCSGGQLLQCLQSKSLEEIADKSLIPMKDDVKPTPIIEAPSEHAIITSWPPENSNFSWITGITADEGMIFTGNYEYFQQKYPADVFMKVFTTAIQNLRRNGDDVQVVLNRFITKESNPILAARKFGTEAYFLYPALKALSTHSGPKYFYVFNHTGGPSFFEIATNKDFNVSGVCHDDDHPYFFDTSYKFKPEGWPKTEDVQLSKTLIKAWVAFANEQTPKRVIPDWKGFEDKDYLHVGNVGLELKKYDEYNDVFNFWKDKI